jgi:uracil-DNA glycosylase family 4
LELPDENELFEVYLNKAVYEMGLLGARIRECKKCKLGQKNEPLTGAGYPLADLFLLKARVSEPELEQGVAFAGPAVEVLGKAFEKMGADISQIYGTNALKCRKDQKEMGQNEIRGCAPYLKAEIEICQPRVIIVMGPVPLLALKTAYKELSQTEYDPGSVVKLRPDLQLVLTCDVDAPLMGEESKKRFWKDLQIAQNIINKESAKEEDGKEERSP